MNDSFEKTHSKSNLMSTGQTNTTVEELLLEANQASQDGDLAVALSKLLEASILAPSRTDIFRRIGTVYYHSGEFSKAIGAFARATQIDPRDGIAWQNHGMSLLQSGDSRQAIQSLQTALRHERNSPTIYFGLASAYEQSGDDSMARSAYREALRLSPNMFEAFHGLGMISLRGGNHREAIKQFENALQINPKYAPSLKALEEATLANAAVNNPFGRLVDQETLDANKRQQVEFVEIDPELRAADRSRVRDLSREVEATSDTFHEWVQNDLLRVLTEIRTEITGDQSKYRLLELRQEFREHLQSSTTFRKKNKTAMARLEAYDEFLRNEGRLPDHS